MKKYFLLLMLLSFAVSFSQSVNNYKYALVPSKFSFLKQDDQYQLNSLTKFLMEKEGFVAFLDTDQMPEEMIVSNCNKVFVDVISDGNFLSTKLTVVLKDCKNNVLFTSDEGRSKEKDYKKGYQEALREAFKSFNKLHYEYKPTVADNNTTTEIVEKTTVIAPVPVATTAVVTTAAVTTTNAKSVPVETAQISEEILFAQPIANGYQLIDTTPKVIMKIYTTSVKDNFMAKKGDVQGVLISKNNEWYFEYYQNDKLISEKVNVKF